MKRPKKPLHIAILGTRGIPARYGGFETFAEELSVRLCQRGHHVTVYCRTGFGQKRPDEGSFRGVALRYIPTIMQKYLETPLHGLLSLIDLFRNRYDVALLCNAANSPFAWLARVRRVPLAINVDGIERQRSKWSWIGKLWYLLGERCSVWFGSRVVADAQVIADYYRETYHCSPAVIAYGAAVNRRAAGSVLQQFALQPKRYILYVSRLEPENNALGVIEAYRNVQTDLPLVIVGDAPYAHDYIISLKQAADERVVFTGYQFAEAYQELQSNCYCYIQATEVGGTHPALIEAMAYGNCILANGTPENCEVVGESALTYPKNDFQRLSELLSTVLGDPLLVEQYGAKASQRAADRYSWEGVCDQYETLFGELTSNASSAVERHSKSGQEA